MTRRIYRSRKESMIAGVCGGLGEYFDIDPVIIRLIFVLLIFAGGAGLIGYIIAWIIIPLNPEAGSPPGTATTGEASGTAAPESQATSPDKRESRALLAGLILITLGVLFLFSNLFHWFRFWALWPVILIVIGAIIILKAKRSQDENPASA
jgi:phage shock protein PspC (stress-responsive transcriptional regulator)